MTKFLITGAGGQLAHRLAMRLHDTGADFAALGADELDVTSATEIEAVLAAHRPEVVFNAAAYTAVDRAETDEDAAAAVNAHGPRLLAQTLAAQGGSLIHVSTDYVFDGTAATPYETGDPTGPRAAYGRTKLAGELAVRAALPERAHVVRTAWVYGGPSANFVDTMRRLERERDTVSVVADQTGSPTYADDLAAALIDLAAAGLPGATWHYTNAGRATWHDLARETFRLLGADPDRVRPIASAEYPVPAPRPAWSVLSTRAWIEAGLPVPRPWTDALGEYLTP